MTIPGLSNPKFRELVQYVVSKCPDLSKLGAVKLNKILYYSEFRYYEKFRKPLTGAPFMKQQFGPVPKNMVSEIATLAREGSISVKRVQLNERKTMMAYTALKPVRPDAFTRDELSVIDAVISDVVENHTAESISKKSHNKVWEYARKGEEIPLFTSCFVAFEKPRAEDIAVGLALANKSRPAVAV